MGDVDDGLFAGFPGERDLADERLWARSTERAQRSRRMAEVNRRLRRRRQATTVALTGAVATSPMAPVLSAAVAQSSADARSQVDAPAAAPAADAGRAQAVLLQFGSTGDQVAQVQRRLAVDDDAIFGPITERAVKRFQSAHGLDVDGVVDAQTWSAIFRSKVVFLKAAAVPAVVRDAIERPAPTAPSPDGARALGSDGASSSTTRGGAAEGDPLPSASQALGEEIREDDAATPEPARAPASLGGDCGTVTPVAGTVTGTYGEDRGSHAHGGQDIAAPAGTAVRAASCGRVSQAGGDDGGYGNLVCIEHEGGRTSCYAHLSTIAAKVGQSVRAGDVIGTVGCTGRCTGPHLHFEVRENGRTTDPRPYLAGSSELSPAAKRRMAAQRATGSPTANATARATPAKVVGLGGATSAPTAKAAGQRTAAPVASGPAPAPAPVAPAPAPQAGPASEPEAAPAPALQSSSRSSGGSASRAAAAPAPAPEVAPAPAPAPALAPEVAPAPAPAPVEQAAPAPTPAPVEEVVPAPTDVAPAPAPAPASVEQAAPAPAPAPDEQAAPATGAEASAPEVAPAAEAPTAVPAPAETASTVGTATS